MSPDRPECTPLQGASFDPSNEDTLPFNIMDLPRTDSRAMVIAEVISDDDDDDDETRNRANSPDREVLPNVHGAGFSAVAEDKNSLATDVVPEPETKLSEAAQAAGDADQTAGVEEEFDVTNFEALLGLY